MSLLEVITKFGTCGVAVGYSVTVLRKRKKFIEEQQRNSEV
jgi:hypothetical protein